MNYVNYNLHLIVNTTESESLEDTRTNINPLERMIKNSKRLHLSTKHLFVNRKDLMFNDLIGWLLAFMKQLEIV